jgi:hypothetical protein
MAKVSMEVSITKAISIEWGKTAVEWLYMGLSGELFEWIRGVYSELMVVF